MSRLKPISKPPSVIYIGKIAKDVQVMEQNYSKNYLTFKALEDCVFTLSIVVNSSNHMQSISYSVDNGNHWTTTNLEGIVVGYNEQTINIQIPKIKKSKTLLLKGIGLRFSSLNHSTSTQLFNSTGKFNVYGNIMSLLYGDDFKNKTIFPSDSLGSVFAGLFKNTTNLINANGLVLPVKNLIYGCYEGMFDGCTQLKTSPILPATTLSERCYESMFNGCIALKTAPNLPATTLKERCYRYMFANCTSLTIAPKISATIVAEECCVCMFYKCTSLISAPNLLATSMEDNCYGAMFADCSSLVNVPAILPATTLADGCYESMFSKCISLTRAPELPALNTKDKEGNYSYDCYRSMFWGCSKLNYIKMLLSTLLNQAIVSWVNGVAQQGTFIKNKYASWTGNAGLPDGWIVETASE